MANGILDAGAGATTELGIIPRGTGGDFRRTLDLPHDVAEAARRIRDGQARPLDAGRVHFRNHSGQSEVRHFVNVASFGFSSTVATRANASSKRFGGKMAFFGATLRALVSYDNTDVWLTIGAEPRERRRVLMAAVGNGRFFGGGMKIRPEARIDDGALDLVTVGDFSKGEVLVNIGRLYEGTHLELDAVQNARVTRVAVEPVEADARIPSSSTARRPGTCRRSSRLSGPRCASGYSAAPSGGPLHRHMTRLACLLSLTLAACTGKYVRSTTPERIAVTPELTARGGYLVNQVASCGACHTPREEIFWLRASAPTRIWRGAPCWAMRSAASRW